MQGNINENKNNVGSLSKIIITSVTENYCEIKIIQYANNSDSSLNENLKGDENIRKATLCSYLLDLSYEYNTFKEKRVLNGLKSQSFFDIEEANEIISKTEIIAWNTGQADLTDPETKAEYDERVVELLEPKEEVLHSLRQMNFIARIYFTDDKYLVGLEIGMKNSTGLDTWICDWL